MIAVPIQKYALRSFMSLSCRAVTWWRDGVLYQIYPRSFADSDGDGIGDLNGIRERLEHLEWLGIDGIWLNPTFPSPNADWGYDVADYYGVHPELGTLQDLDDLIAEANRRGIQVLLDLVPNHTSDRHPWFRERPDFYVWADGDEPPNNWLSSFGGPAWTRDDRTGRWYLHNFAPEQPDLDWWNEAVRDEFDDILRFWFARGVAGFRIDVCHGIVKDRELRDDPAATPQDHPAVRRRGLRQVFSMNRPEVHEVLRRWRAVADAQDPPRILVGETYVLDLDQLIPYYGEAEDELHMAFNFLMVHEELAAEPMRTIVEHMEEHLPAGAWPVYTGSNHDAGRLATRWAQGDPARARVALMMLLTLRGTPFLYYGDEIGLMDAPLDPARSLDPAARDDPEHDRDRCRTPMPWSGEPGGGFTTGERTWLPLGELTRNVADQRADPASTLHLTRDLIALRRAREELRRGAYARLDAPDGAWAFRRGERHAVALNLSGQAVEVAGLTGTILLATDRARDGERVAGTLALGAHAGAVLELVQDRGRS
jgi:alpha-glucosidase